MKHIFKFMNDETLGVSLFDNIVNYYDYEEEWWNKTIKMLFSDKIIGVSDLAGKVIDVFKTDMSESEIEYDNTIAFRIGELEYRGKKFDIICNLQPNNFETASRDKELDDIELYHMYDVKGEIHHFTDGGKVVIFADIVDKVMSYYENDVKGEIDFELDKLPTINRIDIDKMNI